jgi:exodeoxyribonuclease VII small subunit
MTKAQLTFEQAINQLETIVADMETNDIGLDIALTKYQEGISIIKLCQDKLQEAKQRIQILDPENNALKEFTVNEA